MHMCCSVNRISHSQWSYVRDSLRLQVEDSWSAEVRQQFVRFVTGSMHMPYPGMELLRIELPYTALGREDHRKMLGRLPQVCTCRLQAMVKPQAPASLALTLHQMDARPCKATALQAHTCGNILELPNYQESWMALHSTGAQASLNQQQQTQLRKELLQILQDRLAVAVANCSTYGLDEAS